MKRHHFDRHASVIIKSIATGNPDDEFSSDDVAMILRVSTQWLDQARMKGFGPPYDKRGHHDVSYRRGKLIEYLRKRQEAFDTTPRLVAPSPTWPAKRVTKVAPAPVKSRSRKATAVG